MKEESALPPLGLPTSDSSGGTTGEGVDGPPVAAAARVPPVAPQRDDAGALAAFLASTLSVP